MQNRGASISAVIAGLDPAIHLFRKNFDAKKMDPRVKPAGDAAGRVSTGLTRPGHALVSPSEQLNDRIEQRKAADHDNETARCPAGQVADLNKQNAEDQSRDCPCVSIHAEKHTPEDGLTRQHIASVSADD
jgi:hypothetical protein